MFFGGGFPFGFSQGQQGDENDDHDQEEEEDFYAILQVSKDAPHSEIEAKYQQLNKKYQEGSEEADPQKYDEVNEAYSIIGDPQKREFYDSSREQDGHGNMDMLNMMFGGGSKPSKHGMDLPKMQPTKMHLQVPLEKIFNGGVLVHHHERARLCESCNGKGGENVKKCGVCRGQGATVQMMQMGPGMYQQMERECEICKGLGELFQEGKRCTTCDGKKIGKKEVDLQVKIEKGIPAGFVITLENEGNEVVNIHIFSQTQSPGDLILVTKEQPHDVFTRKGADLYMKKHISLIQALLGFNFTLIHLDGREYNIYTQQGEIIGDSDRKIVKNLGMPFFRDEDKHGHLIIQFKVNMPKRGQLNAEQLKVLSNVLPGLIHPRPTDHQYEMLEDFDKEQVNSSEEGGKKKDEEQEGEGQGMGCQAQ